MFNIEKDFYLYCDGNDKINCLIKKTASESDSGTRQRGGHVSMYIPENPFNIPFNMAVCLTGCKINCKGNSACDSKCPSYCDCEAKAKSYSVECGPGPGYSY